MNSQILNNAKYLRVPYLFNVPPVRCDYSFISTELSAPWGLLDTERVTDPLCIIFNTDASLKRRVRLDISFHCKGSEYAAGHYARDLNNWLSSTVYGVNWICACVDNIETEQTYSNAWYNDSNYAQERRYTVESIIILRFKKVGIAEIAKGTF